ncbi:MAG: hypothetical protein ABJN51_20900, partial [Sneathiella sp.]
KYNNKELPIVGLTADAFLERHEQFVESGMNSVLTKPFTQQQLDDVLDLYRNRLSEEKAAS